MSAQNNFTRTDKTQKVFLNIFADENNNKCPLNIRAVHITVHHIANMQIKYYDQGKNACKFLCILHLHDFNAACKLTYMTG